MPGTNDTRPRGALRPRDQAADNTLKESRRSQPARVRRVMLRRTQKARSDQRGRLWGAPTGGRTWFTGIKALPPALDAVFLLRAGKFAPKAGKLSVRYRT